VLFYMPNRNPHITWNGVLMHGRQRKVQVSNCAEHRAELHPSFSDAVDRPRRNRHTFSGSAPASHHLSQTGAIDVHAKPNLTNARRTEPALIHGVDRSKCTGGRRFKTANARSKTRLHLSSDRRQTDRHDSDRRHRG
jgi:hypothetical protein